MRLKNILLVVEDIEQSKEFYRELFGLQVVTDFGEKVMLTEGLVLHEKDSWAKLLKESLSCGNMAELYFEERDFDSFLQRLAAYQKAVGDFAGVTLPEELQQPGRRVVRLRDFDGHIIEVAERS